MMKRVDASQRWIVLTRFADRFGDLFPGDLPPESRVQHWRNLRAFVSSERIALYEGPEPPDACLAPKGS